MGLMRKMTSLSTLGLVDYRSDKERIAKYTRQTRNATRAAAAQNMMQLELQREQLAQGHVHHVESQANAFMLEAHRQQQAGGRHVQQQIAATPTPPPYVSNSIPAGWYDDGQGMTRWYDGTRWTPHTR
jgi:hypothetical protein